MMYLSLLALVMKGVDVPFNILFKPIIFISVGLIKEPMSLPDEP